jgi:hypothetical protein
LLTKKDLRDIFLKKKKIRVVVPQQYDKIEVLDSNHYMLEGTHNGREDGHPVFGYFRCDEDNYDEADGDYGEDDNDIVVSGSGSDRWLKYDAATMKKYIIKKH